MDVFIPTKGRVGKLATYEYIPERWRKKTYVVCPKEEAKEHKENIACNLVVEPEHIRGIADKRQWICSSKGCPHIFFMDDDLTFFKRDENKKLVKAMPEDIGDALDLMQQWLEDGIKAVGFTSRFGNNWIEGDYVECWRTGGSCYGVDTYFLREHGIRFDKFPVCEDFHVMLSVLKTGHINRFTANYVVSASSDNKKGGCNSWRTEELVRETMFEFAQYHKPYAKVVPVKASVQGFNVGYNLRVSWRKAYSHSRGSKLL